MLWEDTKLYSVGWEAFGPYKLGIRLNNVGGHSYCIDRFSAYNMISDDPRNYGFVQVLPGPRKTQEPVYEPLIYKSLREAKGVAYELVCQLHDLLFEIITSPNAVAAGRRPYVRWEELPDGDPFSSKVNFLGFGVLTNVSAVNKITNIVTRSVVPDGSRWWFNILSNDGRFNFHMNFFDSEENLNTLMLKCKVTALETVSLLESKKNNIITFWDKV